MSAADNLHPTQFREYLDRRTLESKARVSKYLGGQLGESQSRGSREDRMKGSIALSRSEWQREARARGMGEPN